MPVALLGLIAYVAVLATAAWRGVAAALVGVVLALPGAAFSAYLLWVQIARIHAICQWCVGNDVVIGALAVLCVARLLREDAPDYVRGFGRPAGRLADAWPPRTGARSTVQPTTKRQRVERRATVWRARRVNESRNTVRC